MVGRLLEEYRELYGTGQAGAVFINEAGTPLRRTLFRGAHLAAVDRPARLLGWVAAEGDKFRGTWPTPAGDATELFKTKRRQAVKAGARHAEGGLRFHDLRHSYAS